MPRKQYICVWNLNKRTICTDKNTFRVYEVVRKSGDWERFHWLLLIDVWATLYVYFKTEYPETCLLVRLQNLRAVKIKEMA
jgi:hypothetical protein